MFDAAVLLRTLYVGLGATGWRFHLLAPRSWLPRLVRESRVPPSVILSRVSWGAPKLEEPVVVVDAGGVPAWSLGFKPRSLVVDYSGTISRQLHDAVRVSGLGSTALTYEAVAVVYEFYIRRPPEAPTATAPGEAEGRLMLDARRLFYLARKMLEAVTVYDNYMVLEPSTVAYTLQRVFEGDGAIVEAYRTWLELDHVEGVARQHIEVRLYSRRLEPRGTITIKYSRGTAVLETSSGERIVFELRPGEGVACIQGLGCIGTGGGEPVAEGLKALLEAGAGSEAGG